MPEEFNVAVRYFGITEQGNFIDHSHPSPLPGQNVLSIVEPLTQGLSPFGGEREKEGASGGKFGGSVLSPSPHADVERAGVRRVALSANGDHQLLASAKKKMLDARNQRVRPHLDDKILASWNGLMLGAFARAYAVLGDETYRAAAEKNLAFIDRKLWDPKSNSLYHRWRDGGRDNVQLLEGCAFLLSGVIELYEATLGPEHLNFAIALAEAMIAKFYEAENGGFWQS